MARDAVRREQSCGVAWHVPALRNTMEWMRALAARCPPLARELTERADALDATLKEEQADE